MKPVWPVALALSCLAAPTTDAATIASYTFTGLPGDEASVPVDAQPPNASFGPIGRGGGITPNAGANSINSRDWTVGTGYYSFTITPNPGQALDLTGLVYTDRRSTSEGPPTIAVEFSTQADFANPQTVASYTLGDNANHREALDLSGFPALADLTTAVEFRILATGATGAVGTYRLGVDANSAGSGLPANLLITGPAAVPEPGSVVLLGLGLAGVGCGARHRRPRP